MTSLIAATGQDVVRIDIGTQGNVETTPLLTGSGTQCIAIDPGNPHRLCAGTIDAGALLSDDAGENWRSAGDGIPHSRVLSVAFAQARQSNGASAIFVGTEPSSLYVSEDNGSNWEDLATLRELPSAPTWSFPPRPWTSHVRWIAPSWHEPDLVFVGIELGGVMRSTDGGATWEDRKPGSYHDSHCVLTHPVDKNRVYESAGGGVATSDDAGETWREVDEGMDRHYVWGLAIHPQQPDIWFVSASHSARYAHRDDNSAEAHIYRKRGDDAWQLLEDGLDPPMCEMPYALLIPRDDPETVYAGTRQGSIFVSPDLGDSWHRMDVSLPGILALAHAPDE